MGEFVSAINSFAEGWAEAIWLACWQGGIALALIWVIVRFLPKLSPSFHCWLWRMAYLKLLVALVWTTPVEVPMLPPEPTTLEPMPTETFTPSQPSFVASFGAQPRFVPTTPTTVPVPSLSYLSWLFMAWLLGVLLISLWFLHQWWQVKQLKHKSKTADGEAFLPLTIILGELCQEFGVRQPTLLISDAITSPLLVGILRPVILLPSSLISEFRPNELRLMFAHELAHLKRHDLLWNLLPSFVQALFFFHPLVWLAQREWQLASEQACDGLVLIVTNKKASEYGEVLLKIAALQQINRRAVTIVVGIAENFNTLKRRLMTMQFIGHISPKRLLVWALVIVTLGIVGIVPWRLTERTSISLQAQQQTRPVSLSQPTKPMVGYHIKTPITKPVSPSQPSRPARQVPMAKGMELVYEGKALVRVSGKETEGPIKVNEFVKEVASDGTTTVVSLRVFHHPVYRPDASLRFVTVRPDGKEIPLDPNSKQFVGEIPPKLFSYHFIRTLPIYFITPRQLKADASWTAKERVPVYLYVTTVNEQFFPLVEVTMRHRVVKRERVGGVACWIVQRSLVSPVPVHGGDWATHLSELNEKLWLDAKTGLVRRAQSEMILQGRKGKFRHNALNLELKRQRVLAGKALERRLKELHMVNMMQKTLGTLIVDHQLYKLWKTMDKEKIDLAQDTLSDLLYNIQTFQHLYPDSHYLAHWAAWGLLLQTQVWRLEQTEEFTERIGKPAPDFELTSVDGEKVRLSDLRGKVVLLNFNAIGIGDKITRWRDVEWLFGYVERFHQDYKDKGVVVLGIWSVHPSDPQRVKKFADMHNLTFPILLDDGKAWRAYKVKGSPTDIVIDKDGKIRFIMMGYVDKRPLKKAIEAALAE